MHQSSIPETLPAILLNRATPGLVWTREQIGRLGGVGTSRPLDAIGFDYVPENTPVELEKDAFVVLGKRLGEGRQGVVYSVATSRHVCVKLCKNDQAAKQFRRERLGIRYFDSLGVEYPAILGADVHGRWIVKNRWPDTDTGETILALNRRILPPQAINSLHAYVHKFEQVGLCADWMPSNVVFRPKGCATFETSAWLAESCCGWSFAACFLPVWLPDGVPESSLEGFPPYTLPATLVETASRAWTTDPAYATWRELYGNFPKLSSDWWRTVG